MQTENLAPVENLPFHVMLAYGPLGLVRATARELNDYGMTVDTGMITLEEQAEVELSFTHRQRDEYVTHRLRTRVTASGRGTAVLAFCDYARTTLDLLHKLVAGETETTHRRSLTRSPVVARYAYRLPPSGRFT